MTWRSFMDYWLMRELDQQDAIARNYVLCTPKAHDNHNFCYDALKRMGIGVRKGNWQFAIDEIVQRLVNMGYQRPDRDVVRIRLNEWYTWDRIRTGEARRVPIKQAPNLLFD